VFAASQLDQVEALCLQFFAVVEVEHSPAHAEPDRVLQTDGPDGSEQEVTIPGLTEQDEEEEDTAVTIVEGSGSDSESAPVRRVIREVSRSTAADEPRERASIESEIDRLTKRLRFLLDRLAELDEPDD